MKINKTQLTQLIKEEMGKVMEMGAGIPGGSSDVDILVQDSLNAIVEEYGTSLRDLRDTLNRMIEEDDNSPIGGTEGYDDDFDDANQWDMP